MNLEELPLGKEGPASRRQAIRTTETSETTSALIHELKELRRTPDDGPIGGHRRTGLTLSINGESVSLFIDPATTLAEVLRQDLQLTGTKIGCDRGACSACTVWIDREVAASCM